MLPKTYRIRPSFLLQVSLGVYLVLFQQTMVEAGWERSWVGVPMRYAERHFLPLSLPLEVLSAGFRSAARVTAVQIARKDTCRNARVGQSWAHGRWEKLPSKMLCLGGVSGLQIKAFWEEGCVDARSVELLLEGVLGKSLDCLVGSLRKNLARFWVCTCVELKHYYY